MDKTGKLDTKFDDGAGSSGDFQRSSKSTLNDPRVEEGSSRNFPMSSKSTLNEPGFEETAGPSRKIPVSPVPTLNDPSFDDGAGPSQDFQRSSIPTQNDSSFDGGAGPSKDFQRSSLSNLDDHELNKERQNRLLDLLEQKYILSYMTKRAINCPDTNCIELNAVIDIVEHLLEIHCNIPRAVIELDTNYGIPIALQDLEYERTHCVAVLLVPITKLRDYDGLHDRSTMAVVVLATKIHLDGKVESTESLEEAAATSAIEPMNNGDLLMIWICGHVESLSSVIKLTCLTEGTTNVYSGHIHSIADINYKPNVVLSRGNCLLVPAHNILEVTDGGQIPLDVEIMLSIKEEDLTD